MAHFAEIENGTVIRVIVADTQEWCEDNLGGVWVQTSYNTIAGKHLLNGEPLRKNYAGIGYSYDDNLDAFIPPKCHNEAILEEESCLWNCTNEEHSLIKEITNG